MKQVIFVGGTPFSGSTFFHLMLANDARGFACGEMAWLFHPRRPGHINRPCSCLDPQCAVWPRLLKNGEAHAYETLFALHPEVEFIVDSSKNPFWIRSQMARLARQNIRARNILIWKTPTEFALSGTRRRPAYPWHLRWTDYHRLYLSLIEDWRSARYSDLVNGADEVLARACQYLRIPYSEAKKEYWNKTHHALGGSPSARFHLHPPDSVGEVLGAIPHREQLPPHRTIGYSGPTGSVVEERPAGRVAEARYVRQLTELLEHYDVASPPARPPASRGVTLPWLRVQLKRLRFALGSVVGQYRYGPTIRPADRAG